MCVGIGKFKKRFNLSQYLLNFICHQIHSVLFCCYYLLLLPHSFLFGCKWVSKCVGECVVTCLLLAWFILIFFVLFSTSHQQHLIWFLVYSLLFEYIIYFTLPIFNWIYCMLLIFIPFIFFVVATIFYSLLTFGCSFVLHKVSC